MTVRAGKHDFALTGNRKQGALGSCYWDRRANYEGGGFCGENYPDIRPTPLEQPIDDPIAMRGVALHFTFQHTP